MIKALLIDNEDFVREDVLKKLTTYFDKEILVVGEADGVATGMNAIETHQPDLLFLDINMDDGTGFDLLNQCPQKGFDIIFITGFDQHAIKAIKVGALDYILKPIDDQEFKTAVQKAVDNYNKENNLDKLIEISSEYFRGVEKKRVILKTADTVYAIYEDDIIYCRSDGNYTTFYTQQLEKIVVSKPLKQIEEILSESVFIRCHQSYIVNKKHVLKYNKQGVLIVHLDFKVPVSSRRKDYALKRIFD
ncbi:MAG: LytTR family DNA-binding domain-containing protein [Bacteroidetes bacterium]|nr:LytTR family DNA-binding domain-containing protein [Bacteroidota bacterium]